MKDLHYSCTDVSLLELLPCIFAETSNKTLASFFPVCLVTVEDCNEHTICEVQEPHSDWLSPFHRASPSSPATGATSDGRPARSTFKANSSSAILASLSGMPFFSYHRAAA